MHRKACGLVMLLLIGCQAPRGPFVIDDPDPSNKIPAIKKAARTKDVKQEAKLIDQLNSDDPAVRFYAIDALQRLTGKTFGYVYYQDDLERKPAVKRWEQWLEQRKTGAAIKNGSATQKSSPTTRGAK